MNLPINWFDLALLAILLIGIQRGRKRGMSEELMPLMKWVAIVVVCALLYAPVGQFISDSTVFSLLSSYMMAYFTIGLLIAILFASVKKAIGGKLLGSDIFGRGEYYLGMVAGLLRFFCILLVGLAFLNARGQSDQEIKAYERYEKDVYGNSFFPTTYRVQREVFQFSLGGKFIHQNLGFLFIKSTLPQSKQIRRNTQTDPLAQ